MSKLTKQEAIAELYRRGDLSWKLDANQKSMREMFYNSKEKINVWLLSRRSGKSFALIVLSIEFCLKNPKSIINYLAPTKLQLSALTRPLIDKILEDCPDQYKPIFNKHSYTYTFYNGSELRLAGADAGHAEKLRGMDSHAAFIDEAGSVDGLDYIVKSILLPTTLITKGKIILASTPPKEAEHDFISYIESCEAKGTLVKKTVYDNPRLTKADIEEMTVELGGEHTDAFRREMLCELLKDSTTSVIPEFTEALEKQIVKEWPRPPFFDCYEAMDLGYSDLTVVLFSYYDFRANKVIIEDELVMDFSQEENNLPKLIKGIKEKEEALWYNPISGEVKKPFMRVSDINPLVTQEIARASNGELTFFNADKGDKDAALHTLRVMLASKKIIIHPRCKTLIRHLKNVKWKNASKTSFARSNENFHYDACDACIYLVRSISYGKNPYPSTYDLTMKDLYIANPGSILSRSNNQIESFKKIFNIRRR